jgi:hypothetical protein
MTELETLIVQFADLVAPHDRGGPQYLIPERACLLVWADVVIARDRRSGTERVLVGEDEYKRRLAGERVAITPPLIVVLDFDSELGELVEVLDAVNGPGELDDDDFGLEFDDCE